MRRKRSMTACGRMVLFNLAAYELTMTNAAANAQVIRWQIICIAAVFVNATLETMLVPALPSIRATFDLTPAQVAWVFTSTTLASAVSLPLLGRLGDIFGSRQVLAGVFLSITTGIAFALFGGTFEALLIGQVLQGFGMALIPLAVAMLSAASGDRSQLSTAPLMLAAALSTAAGLLLAGVVLQWTDYRGLFAFALAPNVIIFIVAFASLRGSGAPSATPFARRLADIDWLGAVLLGIALLSGLIGVTLVESADWTDPAVLSLILGAVSVALLWIWRSLATRSPIVELRLLADPAIGRTAFIQAATGFGTFAAFVLVPLLIATPAVSGGLGLDGSAAAYALAPFGVASILAPPLAAPLRKRLGAGFVMAIATVFAVAGPLTLAFASNIWMVAAATGALGFGIGLVITQSFDLVGAIAPPDRVASMGGLVYVLKMIGAAVGGQVTVSFVGAEPSAQGFFTGFAIATAAMVLAALTAFSLRVVRPSTPAPVVQPQ
jgi:MFS family permease